MSWEIILKQKFAALVLSMSVIILTSSCEYEPEGNYTSDIVKPETGQPIDADLNLLTDTIYFYWAADIRLSLNANSRNLMSYQSYLDNKKVYSYYSGSTFITPLSFYEPGVHKFRIEIVMSSGSGSIAERIGAEAFLYKSREWTLIAGEIDETNLKYKIDAAGLTFTWKKYDGINIKYYRLKEGETRNYYDIQTNYFRHSDYAGEQSYYDVYVVDDQNKEHLWGSCRVNKHVPALSLGSIDNKIALTWKKGQFVDNISEYQVFQKSTAGNWTQIRTVSKNDTSLLLNTPDNVFARKLSFYLYNVPEKFVSIGNVSSFSSYLNDVNVALPGPKFENVIGSDCSGFYYYSYSGSLRKYILYKYSSSTDESVPVSDYQFSYDISPNAKYLLITRDSIVDLFSLTTNSVVKSVNMRKIAPDYSFSANPKVSDNGICTFNRGYTIYAYDILNENLIGTIKSSLGNLNISPGGKYIVASRTDSTKTYRINSNSVTFLSGIKTSTLRVFEFLPDQDEYLYLYVNPLMNVYSCLDLSSIRSMTMGGTIFNIDFCSGKILMAKDLNNWEVYDFNTGSLLQTIRTEIGTGAPNYTLLNHNTIYYTGYKYILGE